MRLGYKDYNPGVNSGVTNLSFCSHVFRSDFTLAMLLMLDRVSYNDYRQAAVVFGEAFSDLCIEVKW